jgi:hypothetical protein
MTRARMSTILSLSLATCLLGFGSVATGRAEEKPKTTLEETFRALHKGLSSKDKEERLKALKAFLVEKKDIEVLFPKHVDIVWKHVEEHRKQAIEMCDEVAKQETKLGDIKEVFPIDMRGKDGGETYKRVLSMIQKDVPVFEAGIKYEKGGSRTSSMVYVNGRWISIWGLYKIPDLLDKNK